MCEVPGSRPLVGKSLEVIRVDDSESCVVSGDGSSKSEEYLLMYGKVDFSYKNKRRFRFPGLIGNQHSISIPLNVKFEDFVSFTVVFNFMLAVHILNIKI